MFLFEVQRETRQLLQHLVTLKLIVEINGEEKEDVMQGTIICTAQGLEFNGGAGHALGSGNGI